MIAGFLLIAFGLFFRRLDDWFAIFTSIFMIVFAGRISSVINSTAVLPGFESKAGLLISVGDISVVLFILLFPNGKFSPPWMKYFVPLLVATMFGIYIFPNMPFHWQKMDQGIYLLVTSTWYLIGFANFLHRYFRMAGVLQKQQMRWVMIGTLAPFLWFLIYNLSMMAFASTINATILSYTLFQVLSRVSSVFLFLILPLFVALAISRSKLFDIDLFIHRSLIYGGLTGGLVLTFALMLGVISLLFRTFHPGDQSMLAMTISAVTAGALFQPARKRLQDLVDRTFYNIQIEYEKTIADSLENVDTSQSEITLSNGIGA